VILFFMLIVLLAIAWGVADHQLQSRIEREPPPVPRSVPAEPRNDEIAVPAEIATDRNPPAADAKSPIEAERPDTPQNTVSVEQPPDRLP